MRNGTSFVRVVSAAEVDPSVWDAHVYAHASATQPPLRDFVLATKPRRAAAPSAIAPWSPIEYRHIPPRVYGTFAFESAVDASPAAAVPGQTLLFGTMRAYLGNVLVTPDPEWVGFDPSVRFQVKSEFLVIEPVDGLRYYWAAILRSPSFLRRLPPGGGGTRPRLDANGLLRLPVDVAAIPERTRIDAALRNLAEQEWRFMIERLHLLGELSV